MPSRILREGILTSERVNSLSESAELFYRRLMSVVDDYGRFYANPSLLVAYCYPLKVKTVTEDLLTAHLAECLDAGLIIRYEVGMKSYLQLVDFKQQVRSKESKYPAPASQVNSSCAANAQHPCTDVHLDVVVVGDVCEDGDGGDIPRKRAATRKTSLPPDFGISPAVRLWAEEKNFGHLDERLEDFIGKAKANGYRYIDWDQAFQNAIRNDWARLSKGNGNGHSATAIRDAERKRVIVGLTGYDPDAIPANARRVG